jgi:hypothetical protein
MVAKQQSIPTKFSALQFRGVEFDTKPCSVSATTEVMSMELLFQVFPGVDCD